MLAVSLLKYPIIIFILIISHLVIYIIIGYFILNDQTFSHVHRYA